MQHTMNYHHHIQKVAGKSKENIFLFTLTTCIWCKKTKKLLKDLRVEYSFVDVDLVLDETKTELVADFEKRNPELSYPTIVIGDGKEVIIGFNEKRIRKLFDDGK